MKIYFWEDIPVLLESGPYASGGYAIAHAETVEQAIEAVLAETRSWWAEQLRKELTEREPICIEGVWGDTFD